MRRCQLVLAFTAWLLASGSQWDLLQGVAWARMFCQNAQSMSVGAAVRRTFAPTAMCPLCRAVSQAKQGGESTTGSAQPTPGKLHLFFQPLAAFVGAVPTGPAQARGDDRIAAQPRPAPPLRPPRSAVA